LYLDRESPGKRETLLEACIEMEKVCPIGFLFTLTRLADGFGLESPYYQTGWISPLANSPLFLMRRLYSPSHEVPPFSTVEPLARSRKFSDWNGFRY
jgi:hypothetical protein